MTKETRSRSSSSLSSSSMKDVEKQSSLQGVDATPEPSGDNRAAAEATADPPRQVEPKAMGDIENAPSTPRPSGPLALDPSEFPDGGVKAWTVVLGAFCCLFVSFGWINCIGVFQDYYQTHSLRDYSPSTVSWISSLEACMMFLWGPVVGKIYDNFGPRGILLAGSFLHVFGLMMTSLATKYYQFVLAQGICSPIGASMIFYPAMSSVTTWFFKRRAFAIGIVASGSSLGGVIFPIMTERLIPRVGFSWTMRICAFLVLFLMTIANLTVRSRIPPHPKPLSLMEFVSPLREIPFFLLTLGMFLTFLTLFLPFNYIIIQATTIGMSAQLAGYLVSILNAVSVFGRVLPGWAGDHFGRFNAMIVMNYFSAIIVLAIWIPANSNAAIIVFAALYGFGTGAMVSLGPSLIAQISDMRQIGVRTGTMFSLISVAALIGNPIGGALVTSWHGNFTGLQIFTGVIMFAGATSILASRVAVGGFGVKTKV